MYVYKLFWHLLNTFDKYCLFRFSVFAFVKENQRYVLYENHKHYVYILLHINLEFT